jgi:hypothetical protein
MWKRLRGRTCRYPFFRGALLHGQGAQVVVQSAQLIATDNYVGARVLLVTPSLNFTSIPP